MKILFFILLIPIFSEAQKVEPIWKLNWGMKYEKAINFIKTTRNIVPNSVKGDTAIMLIVEYKNQQFDGHKAFSCLLYFMGNKLLHTEIFFIPDSKEDKEKFLLFDTIKTALSLKYFEPQYCENAEKYIDDEKMSKERRNAMREKFENNYCNWFFPKYTDSQKGGAITLTYSDKVGLVLIYDYSKAYNILSSDF